MSRPKAPPYPLGLRVPGDIVPTREGYDRWSEVYDGDANPLIALEQPQVERMLGDVRGLRIADVAAGTGRHSLRLANAGARVTALDFSSGMLAKERTKPGADRISFVLADCAAPPRRMARGKDLDRDRNHPKLS